MLSKKAKNLLKGVLKITVTCVALWVVGLKIDFEEILKILPTLHWGLFLLGMFIFTLALLVGSNRLNTLYKAVKIYFSERFNLRLYFLGLFYNLFLPGGVGGDGYKIYLLKKEKISSVKILLKCMMIDRASGVWALLLISSILAVNFEEFEYKLEVLAFILLTSLIFYAVTLKFFKEFKTVFFAVLFKACIVQAFNLLSAFCILLALGVEDHFTLYLFSFLISNLTLIIPFSIGGLGLRELVFIYLANFFLINENISVAVSLLMYVITAIHSLAGSYFVFDIQSIKRVLAEIPKPMSKVQQG